MSITNKNMNNVNSNTLWILGFTIFFLYSFRKENILLPIFFIIVLLYIFYNHNDKLSELKNKIFDTKKPDKRDIHYNDKIVECLKNIEKVMVNQDCISSDAKPKYIFQQSKEKDKKIAK